MIRVLMMFLFTLPLCAQVGLRSPALVSNLHPAAGGCATPNAPTSCTVDEGASPPNHTVTWVAPSGSYDGLEVHASEDGSPFGLRQGGLANGTTTFMDSSTVGDGHVVIYKVRSTNACGTFSAFSNTVTNDIFAGAVSYWKMEEAAGNVRQNEFVSGNAFQLNETGGTVAQASGKNNNAASFTSVAGHYLITDDVFGTGIFDTDFSITLWLYVTSFPLTSADILIREAGSDILLSLNTTGILNWEPAGDGNAVQVALGATTTLHFVALTLDSGAGQSLISVDGATYSDDAGSTPSGDDFLYVCPPFGGLLTLNGRVDELCIFSHALSQAEVTSMYGGGTAPRFK